MWNNAFTISVLSAFFLSSCTIYRPLPLRSPEIPELPAVYRDYYSYPEREGKDEEVRVVSETVSKSYRMRRVEIPLLLPAELTVKNLDEFKSRVETLAETDQKTTDDLKLRYVNRVDYYIPKIMKPGEKRPAILISPILGGNMVVDRFANYYAGRGYVVVLVHRKRTLWEDDEDFDQLERYLRTSILRLRQAVDWLEVQPEVDAKKIGAFGVSYGAILHTVLAAVEPRIQYHVLAMPAAPIAEVIMHCPDRAITKMLKRIREKYQWSDDKIYAELNKSIRTDPLNFAAFVERKKVQIYIALFDRVVGAKRSWRLWRALGKPELKILPFGHYGGVMVFPYLQTQSYRAFKKRLQ